MIILIITSTIGAWKDLERDVKNFIAQNDYPNLMEVMKVNPILRDNDSLCELALLKGL